MKNFVTNGLDAWKAYHGFYQNFFVDHNALLFALLIAAVVGIALSCAFYFGCANNKRNNSRATFTNWWIAFGLSFVIVVLICNFCVIGTGDKKSMLYSHTFYAANDTYVTQQKKNNPTEQFVKNIEKQKNEITTNLNKSKNITGINTPKDFRALFNISCGLFALLVFYVCSVLIKGKSRHGVAIPHLWPMKI